MTETALINAMSPPQGSGSDPASLRSLKAGLTLESRGGNKGGSKGRRKLLRFNSLRALLGAEGSWGINGTTNQMANPMPFGALAKYASEVTK